MDFRYRKPINPGSESAVKADTSVIIFHGTPKPHEVQDKLIFEHWR